MNGYGVTPEGALTWVPDGWANTPPHRLTLDHQSAQGLARAQADHARRIKQPHFHEPDWPPFLISCHWNREKPWRCVTLDPLTGKRTSTWHETKKEALAHGYNSR